MRPWARATALSVIGTVVAVSCWVGPAAAETPSTWMQARGDPAAGRLLAASSREVTALDVWTGKLLWQRDFRGTDTFLEGLYGDGDLVAVIPGGGLESTQHLQTATSDTVFVSDSFSAFTGDEYGYELDAYWARDGAHRFSLGRFGGGGDYFRESAGMAVDDHWIYLTRTSWDEGSVAEIRMEVLDRRTGEVVRDFALPPYIGGPTLANGVLYVSGPKIGPFRQVLETGLVAVDARDGRVLWQHQGAVESSVVVAGGRVVATQAQPVQPVGPTALMMFRLPGRP
jgi:outer membrane protein assembly factor BamB